jgi:Tetratrico peptide repeat
LGEGAAVGVAQLGGDDAGWFFVGCHRGSQRMAEQVRVGVQPPDSGVGLFERAAAFDSTGHSDLAVPLYRQALACGLGGERRRRAVIQLASSLRNLGQAQESVGLLTAELAAGSDHLDDAVRAFLALALVDVGREREAASLALAALAPHLPRYQRSLGNYARLLVEPEPS